MVTSKDHEEERKWRYRFQLYKMRGSGGQGGSYLQKACKGIHRYLCDMD